MRIHSRLAVGLSVAAIAWCLVVGAWMTTLPMMRGGRRPSVGEALGIVTAPVLIAAAGSWAAWRGRYVLLGLVAGVQGLFCFVTGFSIGSAFVPAFGLLVWATFVSVLVGVRS